jgi:ABC-type phosphate transport system ATPase subunit
LKHEVRKSDRFGYQTGWGPSTLVKSLKRINQKANEKKRTKGNQHVKTVVINTEDKDTAIEKRLASQVFDSRR